MLKNKSINQSKKIKTPLPKPELTHTTKPPVLFHMPMAPNIHLGFCYDDRFVLAVDADWQTNKKGLRMCL